MQWFFLAWRNVIRNRRRSLMAGSVVAAAAAAIVIAIGFVSASFWGLRETTIASGLGHFQIAPAGSFDSGGQSQARIPSDQVASIETELRKIPDFSYSMRRLLFEGLASTGERTVAVVGSGVEPDKEARLAGAFVPFVAGGALPSGPKADRFATVLTEGLARSLDVQVGQSITLLANTDKGGFNAIDLTVVGVYRTGIPELDARTLMVPVETAQMLLQTSGISRVVTVLRQTPDGDTGLSTLNGDEVRSWHRLAPFYRQVVEIYRQIFTVMGVIIIAVVTMATANSMLTTVMERIPEIGMMMAFGIPKLRIQVNYWMEGAIIGTIGALVGCFIAVVLAFAINMSDIQLPPPPGRSTTYQLLIFFEPWAYLFVVLLMTVAGAVAAWWPARHAVRIKVIDALNHR